MGIQVLPKDRSIKKETYKQIRKLLRYQEKQTRDVRYNAMMDKLLYGYAIIDGDKLITREFEVPKTIKTKEDFKQYVENKGYLLF